MRGGRRKGAGRKQGSGDKRLELVRFALSENRERLIGTAIRLATGRKPSVPILAKLLDKCLPSLHSAAVSGTLSTTGPDFGDSEMLERALSVFKSNIIREFEQEREAGASKVVTAQPAGKRIGPDRQPG